MIPLRLKLTYDTIIVSIPIPDVNSGGYDTIRGKKAPGYTCKQRKIHERSDHLRLRGCRLAGAESCEVWRQGWRLRCSVDSDGAQAQAQVFLCAVYVFFASVRHLQCWILVSECDGCGLFECSARDI